MSDPRVNPLTEVAEEAIEELDELITSVIAEFSIPLGQRVVPESTRRARGKKQAREIADLLVQLSAQFGADQVVEVLGLPLDAMGSTMFDQMVQQYGEETVARALTLAHIDLQRATGTPDEQRFLPAEV